MFFCLLRVWDFHRGLDTLQFFLVKKLPTDRSSPSQTISIASVHVGSHPLIILEVWHPNFNVETSAYQKYCFPFKGASPFQQLLRAAQCRHASLWHARLQWSTELAICQSTLWSKICSFLLNFLSQCKVNNMNRLITWSKCYNHRDQTN